MSILPTSPFDKSSFANNDKIVVEHYDIHWTANFQSKQLIGHVNIRARVIDADVKQMVLDARSIRITKVANNEKELIWHQDTSTTTDAQGYPQVFGHPLLIEIGGDNEKLSVDQVINLRIEYATTEQSEAIQWLSKEQTVGKQHPYLFTQAQAIHARSMLPCQDTPSSKSTYTAHITCDQPLVAVMSAASTGNETLEGKSATVYHFEQNLPIPAYLIALGIGALKSVEIGPRSILWSEPEMLEAGAFEFANTENFIKAAEEFLPPYAWGRYDLLLLPPSFPYGGMENPNLVFITPTLLAGDRSLENVVAHEIAHAWSGNLVTNQNWESFWLNEGFTVYIERRIIARLSGEKEAEFHAQLGYFHLIDSVKQYEEMKLPALTKMMPDLTKIDPDDSFSSLPYEKGFNFLYYLDRQIVGSTEKFEAFLKSYFTKFAKKSITANDMKQYFIEYFTPILGADKLNQIDWDNWFFSEGYPPVKNDFDKSLSAAAKELADKWANNSADRFEDISQWSSNQICFFLDSLLEDHDALPQSLVDELEETFKFTQRQNSEIRFRFLMIALKANCEKYYGKAVELATQQGRMKFTRPLYRSLNKAQNGRLLAVEAFEKHRNQYHLICSKMVARDLGL